MKKSVRVFGLALPLWLAAIGIVGVIGAAAAGFFFTNIGRANVSSAQVGPVVISTMAAVEETDPLGALDCVATREGTSNSDIVFDITGAYPGASCTVMVDYAQPTGQLALVAQEWTATNLPPGVLLAGDVWQGTLLPPGTSMANSGLDIGLRFDDALDAGVAFPEITLELNWELAP